MKGEKKYGSKKQYKPSLTDRHIHLHLTAQQENTRLQ